MTKIGITNVPEVRLKKHGKSGWQVREIRGPMDGDLAASWELSMLHLMKARGVRLGDTSASGPFDGYTEAWPTEDYPVQSLRSLMDAVEQAESEGHL